MLHNTKRLYIVVSSTYIMSRMAFRSRIFDIGNHCKEDIHPDMSMHSPPELLNLQAISWPFQGN
jgi:hypothetical protein